MSLARLCLDTGAENGRGVGQSATDALYSVWLGVDPDGRGAGPHCAPPRLRAPHVHLLRMPRHGASRGLHQTRARERQRAAACRAGSSHASSPRSRGAGRPSGHPWARGGKATRALSARVAWRRRAAYARARTFETVIACQRPPRAVGMPRAFRALAMARRVGASSLDHSSGEPQEAPPPLCALRFGDHHSECSVSNPATSARQSGLYRPTRESLSKPRVSRHFGVMRGSPCPEFKRRSANQPYCLRGCFSVSRFCPCAGPNQLV